MIGTSIEKCCISSALDGNEDDGLWNDTEVAVERGNESTSTSLGITVMIVNMMINA